MAYTTIENLELIKSIDELTQLTDGVSTPNVDKINQAINKADRYIDGFLYGSVEGWTNGSGIIPLPEIISDISSDLSIFFLYNIKYGESYTIYEEKGIYKRYNEAIKILERIQKKQIIINSIEKAMPTIYVSAPDQVFTSDILSGY